MNLCFISGDLIYVGSTSFEYRVLLDCGMYNHDTKRVYYVYLGFGSVSVSLFEFHGRLYCLRHKEQCVISNNWSES